MPDPSMPRWSERQQSQVRVLLFGWPLWTADPERAREAFDTMPTGHPDRSLAARRAVHHWHETGIPHDRVLAYLQAGVSLTEAVVFEDDPWVDTTSPEFADSLQLLAALQPPRPTTPTNVPHGQTKPAHP